MKKSECSECKAKTIGIDVKKKSGDVFVCYKCYNKAYIVIVKKAV